MTDHRSPARDRTAAIPKSRSPTCSLVLASLLASGCGEKDKASGTGPDIGPDAIVCGEPEDSVRNDEEIAALAGCEVYQGRVRLGRDVTDLTPLSSLRVIRGSLAGEGWGGFDQPLDG